jgi:hypothetical protein
VVVASVSGHESSSSSPLGGPMSPKALPYVCDYQDLDLLVSRS